MLIRLYAGPFDSRGTVTNHSVSPFSAGDLAQHEDQQNGWVRFVSSVTARYNVAQLVEKVRAMAEFTFDFISLLIVAS